MSAHNRERKRLFKLGLNGKKKTLVGRRMNENGEEEHPLRDAIAKRIANIEGKNSQ